MPHILRYTIDFNRTATIKTPKGNIKVGDITYFFQRRDGTLDVNIEFYPLLPEELRKRIEKNPSILGIESKPVAKNILMRTTSSSC